MAVLAVVVGVPAAAAAPAAAATSYTITDLGSLGGRVAHGLAINASGQVTGDSVSSTLVQVPCPPRQYGGQKKCFTHLDDAFEWSNGTMTDLGSLGGNFSQGSRSTAPARWSAGPLPRTPGRARRSCRTGMACTS
jgi:probable HAF family extracellular repeat protein